jgi:hypothetical protein
VAIAGKLMCALVSQYRQPFDHFEWTLYPTEDVLLHLISIEEKQLLERERKVAAREADPGRPSYEASYGEVILPCDYIAVFNERTVDYHKLVIVRQGEREEDEPKHYQTGLAGPGSAAARCLVLPPISSLIHPNIVVHARTHVLQVGLYKTPGADVSPASF